MCEFLSTDRIRLDQIISRAGYVGTLRDTKPTRDALHETGLA